MNRRQQRLIAILRSLEHAYVKQYNGSAAWYVSGVYPICIRVKLTCRDVHGLVRSGHLSGGRGARVLMN